MDNFKIYSVTDEYIDYLRIIEPNVYSNKVENRIHTRKYIGTVLEMNGYKYFVPMSSPKDTQVVGHTPVDEIYEENGFISTDVFSTYRDGRQIGESAMVVIDSVSREFEKIEV